MQYEYKQQIQKYGNNVGQKECIRLWAVSLYFGTPSI